jgi:hypothetical protein
MRLSAVSAELQAVIQQSPLRVHPERYAVAQVVECRDAAPHFLVSHETDEVTVITTEAQFPQLQTVRQVEKWFRLLEFRVAVPFQSPGFLAAIAQALAAQGLNILLYSTFSKDWALLHEAELERGIAALKALGFPMSA